MVLCLRNTLYRNSWDSLTSPLVYQVAHRSQSGHDRLSDSTFKICRAGSNEDAGLITLAFVSDSESEKALI